MDKEKLIKSSHIKEESDEIRLKYNCTCNTKRFKNWTGGNHNVNNFSVNNSGRIS
jgi:hypothetical protein